MLKFAVQQKCKSRRLGRSLGLDFGKGILTKQSRNSRGKSISLVVIEIYLQVSITVKIL